MLFSLLIDGTITSLKRSKNFYGYSSIIAWIDSLSCLLFFFLFFYPPIEDEAAADKELENIFRFFEFIT